MLEYRSEYYWGSVDSLSGRGSSVSPLQKGAEEICREHSRPSINRY